MSSHLHIKLLSLFLLGMVLSSLTIAAQDEETKPVARYGVDLNLLIYPQDTVQASLSSVAKAMEKQNFRYVLAHLMEPRFVEARIEDRAAELIDGIEQEFRVKRDVQRRDPGFPVRQQLPLEPQAFAQAIREEAKLRAFGSVLKDLQDFHSENPEVVRRLQKYLREGVVADQGDTATVTLRGVANEQIRFVKINNRYHMLNTKTATER